MMRGLLVIILELVEELVNVRGDFARLLLIDEVSYSFHNDDFLQRGNVSFEATIIMNIFFHSREVIDQVQIPYYELCWHLHLCSSPCCCQLPCSAFLYVEKNPTGKTLLRMRKYYHIIFHRIGYLPLSRVFLFYFILIIGVYVI